MSNQTLFPHSFPKFFLASRWGSFGKSAAAVLHPTALVSKSPGSFKLLEWFSKLMTVALKKFVQTAVRYSTGSYRRPANGWKPMWLTSEINSNFLKITLLNRCGMSRNQVWEKNKTKLDLRPTWNLQFLQALESSQSRQSPGVSTSNPVQWVCIPILGHSGILPSGCWKCRDTPAPKLRIL